MTRLRVATDLLNARARASTHESKSAGTEISWTKRSWTKPSWTKPFWIKCSWTAAVCSCLAFTLMMSPNASAQFHKSKLSGKLSFKHHKKFNSGFHHKSYNRGFQHKSFNRGFSFQHKSRFHQPKSYSFHAYKSHKNHSSFNKSKFYSHSSRPHLSTQQRLFVQKSHPSKIIIPSNRSFSIFGSRHAPTVIHKSSSYTPKKTYSNHYAVDYGTRISSAGLHINDAWTLLRSGQDARARMAFGELASASPRSPQPKIGFAMTSALLGHHDMAVVAFDRALAIDPQILQRYGNDPIAQATAHDLLSKLGTDHGKLRGYLEQIAVDNHDSHDYAN